MNQVGYLGGRTHAREQSHRRGVLLGMAVLILFSTSPIFGHHLASRADALLIGRDHVFQLCLVALHLLLQPVHLMFHLLLVVGLLYSSWDRLRASFQLRALLQAVEWRTPSSTGVVADAVRASGLALDRVRVVDSLPSPAFTVGFWTPRIYLARELGAVLTPDQVHAVIAHEAAHVRRRDPLRLSTLRFFACTLFYLPALRRLADDAADDAEIRADDEAASRSGDSVTLASALVEIARRWPAGGSASVPLPATGVSAGGSDLLDRRVRRLLGEDAVVGTHVTRRSLGGAGAVLAMVWISGLMMAHPLPPDVAADGGFMGLEIGTTPSHHGASMRGSHCDHYGAFALTHLFCLGRHAHATEAPCPHAAAVAGPSSAG
jgi:Zn-dependent protease with chaperone function